VVRSVASAPKHERRVRPVTMAKATTGEKPILVVVPSQEAPDKTGHVRAEVYQLAPNLAKLRRITTTGLRSGENLTTIAKKFRVTKKSILVANGLTSESTIRSHSVIRVPGTFDEVSERPPPGVRRGSAGGERLAVGSVPPDLRTRRRRGGLLSGQSRSPRHERRHRPVKLKIGSKEARLNQVVVLMDHDAFLEGGPHHRASLLHGEGPGPEGRV